MSGKQMLGVTVALATELSALIIGGYYVTKVLSDKMGWDENTLMAFVMPLCLLGWLIHAYVFFKKYAEDSDDISPHS